MGNVTLSGTIIEQIQTVLDEADDQYATLVLSNQWVQTGMSANLAGAVSVKTVVEIIYLPSTLSLTMRPILSEIEQPALLKMVVEVGAVEAVLMLVVAAAMPETIHVLSAWKVWSPKA